MNLNQWMLKGARQFVIEHKGIFEKAIIAYASILPEPTIENTTHPNTHILIGIRDKFFEYEDNPCKRKLQEAAWKIAITEHEHDPYYRYRYFGWVLEEILESDWFPRPLGHPVNYWNEPERDGEEGQFKIVNVEVGGYAK